MIGFIHHLGALMLTRQLILVSIFFLSLGTVSAQPQPWAEPGAAPSGDATWIELTSGEWLKGTISALYDSVVYFDSEHFGNIRIKLSKIRRISGHGEFEITLQGQSPLNGNLEIVEESVVIAVGSQRFDYDRTELIAITPSAKRERDRWSGSVRMGVSLRRGNSDISEADLAMGAIRRTPTSRVTADYLAEINETEGERIADSHRVNITYDQFAAGRLFWRPVSFQYFHDRPQNIQHQATIDSGVGYRLVDSPRVNWDIQAGIGVNYLNHVSVIPGESENETSPVGTLGSDLTVEVTPSIDYELFVDMNFLNSESGRYQHHIVTSLSTNLIGNLDFDVSLIWDRTEKPQRKEDGTLPEKDDLRLIFGLGYDF
jgi:putative salt-induced outer membrane protein YdiY